MASIKSQASNNKCANAPGLDLREGQQRMEHKETKEKDPSDPISKGGKIQN